MSAAVFYLADLKSSPKSKKFPVFYLLIRELDAESSSHETA